MDDGFWADPGVLWKEATGAMRAMRGSVLEANTISTVLWIHRKLPQSTVLSGVIRANRFASIRANHSTKMRTVFLPLFPRKTSTSEHSP